MKLLIVMIPRDVFVPTTSFSNPIGILKTHQHKFEALAQGIDFCDVVQPRDLLKSVGSARAHNFARNVKPDSAGDHAAPFYKDTSPLLCFRFPPVSLQPMSG